MKMRYIQEGGVKYRIRGPYSASDLRKLFDGFVEKFSGTKITFAAWLVRYGKVYNRTK